MIVRIPHFFLDMPLQPVPERLLGFLVFPLFLLCAQSHAVATLPSALSVSDFFRSV